MTDIRLYHKVCKYKKKMNIELNYGLALVLAHKNTKAIVIFFYKKEEIDYFHFY
ncbi:hypothetical protein PROPEN_03552 [Proteus penneri ATCC 35198]|nr:hypothetical protein PROPEN_03552 [Proteus penneri ATCC 35198]